MMCVSVGDRFEHALENAAAALPLEWSPQQHPQGHFRFGHTSDYPGEYGRGRQQLPWRIAVLVVRGETPRKGMAKLASLPRKGWRVSRLHTGMFLKELSLFWSRLSSPHHRASEQNKPKNYISHIYGDQEHSQ